MIAMNLRELAEAVGGTIHDCSGEERFNQVVIDSRKIPMMLEQNFDKKILFVALRGENVDGNQFAAAAINGGAIAVMTDGQISSAMHIPRVVVSNASLALKKLAKYYRSSFDIPFIGVTGSTGKTSTKEMIASVLSQEFHVHKTLMNFNNEIGLPLTMLELEQEHQVSVLEMGMDKFGEIACLADIANPSIGVITNIGTAHMENLGSRENIMKAKLELTAGFDKNNLLIINGDDDLLAGLNDKEYEIKRVSIKENGDYNATELSIDGTNGVCFSCIYQGKNQRFKISLPGIHNVYNALVAIAIADRFQMTAEKVCAGITAFKPVGQRMDIIELENGITLINDCYNANPDSMKAAINVLEVYNGRRKIAVLGDMYELGSYTEEGHKLIGNHVSDRCDLLVAVGESSSHIYNSALDCKSCECKYFKTKEEASAFLKMITAPNDVLLIKGSRGMKMEEITNSLVTYYSSDEDRKRV